jgi:hypothetical protein
MSTCRPARGPLSTFRKRAFRDMCLRSMASADTSATLPYSRRVSLTCSMPCAFGKPQLGRLRALGSPGIIRAPSSSSGPSSASRSSCGSSSRPSLCFSGTSRGLLLPTLASSSVTAADVAEGCSGRRGGLARAARLPLRCVGGGKLTGTARLRWGKVSARAVRMSPASWCSWSICDHPQICSVQVQYSV